MLFLRNNRIQLSLAVTIAVGLNSCRWGFDFLSTEGFPEGSGGLSGSGGGVNEGGQGGSGGAGTPEPDAWWDEAFGSRHRVELNNDALNETLTDFPVAIHLDEMNFDYVKAGPSGEQIRFVDQDGTILDFEIEEWDPMGESVLWIKVPELAPAGNEDFIWIYYDNPDALAATRPEAVWTNAYLGVWHLNRNTEDSTAFAHDGVNNSAVPAPGELAGGYEFFGTDESIDVGGPDDLHNIFATGATVTAWSNLESYDGAEWPRIVDKSSDTASSEGWSLQYDGSVGLVNALSFEHDFDGGRGTWATDADTLPTGAWYSVAVVYDSSSDSNFPQLFINGSPFTANLVNTPSGTAMDDSDQKLSFGNLPIDGGRSFDGVLDEIRISNIQRSSEWLLAEYQTAVGTLTTIRSVDTRK